MARDPSARRRPVGDRPFRRWRIGVRNPFCGLSSRAKRGIWILRRTDVPQVWQPLSQPANLICQFLSGPVVQRIGLQFPKLNMQVRYLPALAALRDVTYSGQIRREPDYFSQNLARNNLLPK